MRNWCWLVVLLAGSIAGCLGAPAAVTYVDMPFADVVRTAVPAQYASLNSLELQLKFARIVRTRVFVPPGAGPFPFVVFGFEEPERFDYIPPLLAQNGCVLPSNSTLCQIRLARLPAALS